MVKTLVNMIYPAPIFLTIKLNSNIYTWKSDLVGIFLLFYFFLFILKLNDKTSSKLLEI